MSFVEHFDQLWESGVTVALGISDDRTSDKISALLAEGGESENQSVREAAGRAQHSLDLLRQWIRHYGAKLKESDADDMTLSAYTQLRSVNAAVAADLHTFARMAAEVSVREARTKRGVGPAAAATAPHD